MNVGFHHRGVDAESLSVFQTQLDSRLDHELIDVAKRLRGKPVEGAVEGILLGNGLAFNMIPFLALVVTWVVGVVVIRMRDQRELQREIDELDDTERENRR